MSKFESVTIPEFDSYWTDQMSEFLVKTAREIGPQVGATVGDFREWLADVNTLGAICDSWGDVNKMDRVVWMLRDVERVLGWTLREAIEAVQEAYDSARCPQ